MRLIAYALLIAVASQQHPPAQPTSNQQRADSSARGAQNTPLTIKLDSAQADKYAKRAEQERRDKAATDTNIVRLTAGLVLVGFFQLLLFGWQLWIMGKSLVDTKHAAEAATIGSAAAKEAADAAKESAESYRSSERAWVSYIGFDISGAQGTDATGRQMSGAIFAIKWLNAGRTPAIHCSLMSEHKVSLPPYGKDVPFFAIPPDMGQRATPLIPGVPVTSPGRFIEQPDMQRLIDRKCKIFLYGRAEYELIFPQDSGPDSSPQTEVCVEVTFFGTNQETGKPHFTFAPTGPQNSAR